MQEIKSNNDKISYDIQRMVEATNQTNEKYIESVRDLNNEIRLLSQLMKDTEPKSDVDQLKNGQGTNDFYETPVSRAITASVPLIPSNFPLSALVEDITEYHMHNFLIRNNRYIELITSQNIFDYIADGHDFKEDTVSSNIKKVRIPFVPRTMSMRKAFNIMSDRNIPLLLIEWTADEQLAFSDQNAAYFPNIVTLSQIYSMMSQRLIEDGVINAHSNHTNSDLADNDSTINIDSHIAHSISDTAPHHPSIRFSQALLPLTTSKAKQNNVSRSCYDCFVRLCTHYITRGLIILTLVIDWILCAINILGFYEYRMSTMYLVMTIICFIEWTLRVIVHYDELKWTKQGLELVALILSSICYFVDVAATKEEEGFLRLLLLIRLLRHIFVFNNVIALFSNDIRKIFNRSRARQKEKNLDITNISSRIIAMSKPGVLWESVYRNNIKDVEEFLNKHHMGHYWVLNLCEEEKGYSKQGLSRFFCGQDQYFGGRYTQYCIQDHNPCSLDQLKSIIYQCTDWLEQDPSNVVAVHCKGGKGRTGMVVACLLIRQGLQCNPVRALEYFASKRTSTETKNNGEKHKVKRQQVSSPSQMRYVCYFNYSLDHIIRDRGSIYLTTIEIPINDRLWGEVTKLTRFTVNIVKNKFEYEVDDITGCIKQDNTRKSKKVNEPKQNKYSYCYNLSQQFLEEDHIPLIESTEMKLDYRRHVASLEFDTPVECKGDIRITIKTNALSPDSNLFVWFNTDFVTDTVTVFTESEIDKSKNSISSSSSTAPLFFTTSAASASTSSVSIAEESSHMLSSSSSVNSLTSMNMHSTSSVRPDDSEKELYILCAFTGNSLEDTEEAQQWRTEKELADQLPNVPSSTDSFSAFKSISIIQKAKQLGASTLNLISRVSSTKNGLRRSPSNGSSATDSNNHLLGNETDAERTETMIQMRDMNEIERRRKMKLNSLHESEEFNSANSTIGTETYSVETKPLNMIDESSDEIQLDSDNESQ